MKEYGRFSKPQYIYEGNQVFDGKKSVNNTIYRRLFGLLDEELDRVESLDSCVTATCKLYKSKIIKDNDILFLDTKKIGTEDALFNISVFSHVEKCIFIKEYLYHYRKTNENSLTSIKKENLKEKWFYLFDLMQEHIDTNKLNVNFQESLDNRVSLSFIGVALNEVFSTSGHRSNYKNIINLTQDQRYVDAIQRINTKNMNRHWKLFYYLLKNKMFPIVFIMLLVIKRIIRK